MNGYIRFFSALLLTNSLHAATSATSVNVGVVVGSTTLTSRGQTTRLYENPLPRNVGSNGRVTCPQGTIMTGVNVSDNGSAYTNIWSLRINGRCDSGWPLYELSWTNTRVQNRLVTNPSAFTYTITCTDIRTDFF